MIQENEHIAVLKIISPIVIQCELFKSSFMCDLLSSLHVALLMRLACVWGHAVPLEPWSWCWGELCVSLWTLLRPKWFPSCILICLYGVTLTNTLTSDTWQLVAELTYCKFGSYKEKHSWILLSCNVDLKTIDGPALHAVISHSPKTHPHFLNWWLELVLQGTVSTWVVDLIEISHAGKWDKTLRFRNVL